MTSTLRADARRNRERILEAALVELTRSPNAPLSTIAKRAGIGQGTLYRHFPDRDALVLELYRREVEQLVASAPLLLERLPPDRALREWMDRLAHFALIKPGLALALRDASAGESATAPGYSAVFDAIGDLLAAGRDAGVIRPDVSTDDFIVATAGLWLLDSPEDRDVRVARLLDFVMDGLRARSR